MLDVHFRFQQQNRDPVLVEAELQVLVLLEVLAASVLEQLELLLLQELIEKFLLLVLHEG